MMSHEKLDVYQLAIKFLSLARRILKRIPKGNADLADQLKRASSSIPLLIAEGVGKTTPCPSSEVLLGRSRFCIRVCRLSRRAARGPDDRAR